MTITLCPPYIPSPSCYRRIAIIADPGFGKTTFTQHLTLSYANGSFQDHKVQALLPILLLLRTIYLQIQTSTLSN
ncbi:MAG: hypothetical protein K6T90_14270 [Leptolyngbyaceae cyanobacterium HOT.MB2.61]|nr:hypothetical protein [Leptolyngbyaceae cyanobacterium HOT.MB2.61]